MFLRGCSICCVLLTLRISAWGLEISGYESNKVICSQGLSDCTLKDSLPFPAAESDEVDVKNLTPNFKLCCKDRAPCILCLLIDTEVSIGEDSDVEDEGHSGLDEEDYSEERNNSNASVTVCYDAAHTVPTCKKVEFTVNHTALAQQHQTKLSIVITEPASVSFSSHGMVYSLKSPQQSQEVVAPSLDEVCSQEVQERVKECRVPKLKSVINQKLNRVELQYDDNNNSLPSVCVQYEQNGICKTWSRMTIPLYSVTPCMCFQIWNKDDQWPRRSLSCPFVNTDNDFLNSNVWQNVSVSVSQGQMYNHRSVLWWNLSAPCRLEGEVWPCHKEISCREIKGFRQQLTNGTWRQNSEGQWEKKGAFENINLQLPPCVMVRIKGMEGELGPFCFTAHRWRWSLLTVGVMLLVCLTVLIFYFLRDFVKKLVWSWHHGKFEYAGTECHVVLLSPPDVDDGVSGSVCQLGSLLRDKGFSVSVDQWSRKEQCNMGPLPWLHSQLLEMKSHGGRVVLILTCNALERAEEWTYQHKEVIKPKGEDWGLPQIGSPYSDVFMASLCLIQAHKQLGTAQERFVLVTFDSPPCKHRSLPELLQGLLLFQLPSQTKALVSELTVGGTRRMSGKRTWTGCKWNISDGWRAKAEKELDQQMAPYCKYSRDEKNLETKPLKYLNEENFNSHCR